MELPHTAGCLVCGRENPHGLRLHFHVDDSTGKVETLFTPTVHHIGFEGMIHGGVLATVLDEIMVWAATWKCKCFCVCAELSVRFRNSAIVGEELRVSAEVTEARSKITYTTGTVLNARGDVVAVATGKYMTLPPERNKAFVATLISEPVTKAAHDALK